MPTRRRKPANGSLEPAASACKGTRIVSPTSLDADAPLHSPYLFCFRAVFACAIISDCISMARSGELEDFFGVPSRINFVYRFAPFVRPGVYMSTLPAAMAMAAIAFGTGAAPCAGLVTFCTAATYLFLCDASRFVNHHYFYILLAGLLLLAAADTPDATPTAASDSSAGAGVVLRYLQKRCRAPARRWHLSLLRLQCSILFFYGAAAKCTRELLVRHEPLRSFVASALAPGGRLHSVGVAGWRVGGVEAADILQAEWSLAAGAVFAIAFDLGAAVALSQAHPIPSPSYPTPSHPSPNPIPKHPLNPSPSHPIQSHDTQRRLRHVTYRAPPCSSCFCGILGAAGWLPSLLLSSTAPTPSSFLRLGR